jgi:isoamylase
LNDLVSYSGKHNEANGEGNLDGFDKNLACNHGAEGPSPDPRVETLRNRQAKNFLATLLLSLGTPMLLGGDELRRSQQGNNNAWCQNNEVSWYDWGLLDAHADLHRFTRALIGLRLRHGAFLRPEFYATGEEGRAPDILWLAPDGGELDWARAGQGLGCRLDGERDVLLLFNAGPDPLVFRLPPVRRRWHRAVDTALPSPQDAPEPGQEPPVEPADTYTLEGRSLAVLLAR